MIRVLVVDDQPLIRAGIARILGPDDGFTIVGECSDGDQVIDAVADLDPEVVLMDIRMARVDGVGATRRLRDESGHAPPVLVLTTFDDDDALWGALDAGAAGFVLKDTDAQDLIAATRAVSRGASWLDPKVAPRVLRALQNGTGAPAVSTDQIESLTARELDVLRHMAQGATNNEIASALFVSEATVKSHIGSIFAKLGARDRAAAIVLAYDLGIVRPRPH